MGPAPRDRRTRLQLLRISRRSGAVGQTGRGCVPGRVATAVPCAGLRLDVGDNMAAALVVAEKKAALDPAAVLLELPITDLYGDTKALLNATRHGRTMVNGYSGYSPPHYGALASGTRTMDAHVLDALRQARPLGIYIDPDRDADGRYRTFLEAQPGVTRVASSTGALFVLPALHTDDSQH